MYGIICSISILEPLVRAPLPATRCRPPNSDNSRRCRSQCLGSDYSQKKPLHPGVPVKIQGKYMKIYENTISESLHMANCKQIHLRTSPANGAL